MLQNFGSSISNHSPGYLQYSHSKKHKLTVCVMLHLLTTPTYCTAEDKGSVSSKVSIPGALCKFELRCPLIPSFSNVTRRLAASETAGRG